MGRKQEVKEVSGGASYFKREFGEVSLLERQKKKERLYAEFYLDDDSDL